MEKIRVDVNSINTLTLEYVINDPSDFPPELIKRGILQEKSLLLITGQPKARKSFLAFNLAIALARGEGFAGFEIEEPWSVLILSSEGGYYPNRERLKVICKGEDKETIDRVNYSPDVRININDDEGYQLLRDEIEKYRPDVVIIDPLIRFHNVDENSSNEMSFILRRIRSIIEDFICSVILVHHQGKDPRSGARGSSALLGEYDSEITILPTNADSVHKIQFNLRHAESPDDTTFFFNSGTFWFEEDKKADPFLQILEQDGQLLKKEWVDKAINLRICSSSTAYDNIKRLQKEGKVKLGMNNRYSVAA